MGEILKKRITVMGFRNMNLIKKISDSDSKK